MKDQFTDDVKRELKELMKDPLIKKARIGLGCIAAFIILIWLSVASALILGVIALAKYVLQ